MYRIRSLGFKISFSEHPHPRDSFHVKINLREFRGHNTDYSWQAGGEKIPCLMWLEYRDWLFRNIPTILRNVAFGPFLSFKRSKKDPLVKDQKLRGQLSNWNKYLIWGTHTKDETSRKMSRTGRPAGDAAFVCIVERLTTCDLSKGKPGSRLKRVSRLVLYLRNSKVQED